MIAKTAGKGRAVLIGSFVALAYHEQHDPATRQLLLALARGAGVVPRVEVSGSGAGEVEVRRLLGKDQQIILVFNHAEASADASIAVHLPWAVKQARELQNDAPVNFQQKNGLATFQKHLAAGETWVFSLHK